MFKRSNIFTRLILCRCHSPMCCSHSEPATVAYSSAQDISWQTFQEWHFIVILYFLSLTLRNSPSLFFCFPAAKARRRTERRSRRSRRSSAASSLLDWGGELLRLLPTFAKHTSPFEAPGKWRFRCRRAHIGSNTAVRFLSVLTHNICQLYKIILLLWSYFNCVCCNLPFVWNTVRVHAENGCFFSLGVIRGISQ